MIRIVVLVVVLATVGLPRFGLAQQGQIASWERQRVALIVGAGAYQHLPALPNPPRDAELIAAEAGRLGFQVMLVTDPTRKELFSAISDLRAAVADSKAVALFYFAGHAVQAAGQNKMLTVDSKATGDGVGLDEVFLALSSREPDDVNIVILDACRDSPFADATTGLAKPATTTPGTYIAYAAAPGEKAFDGEGANSPFSAALAAAMQIPGITIEEALREVRADVGAMTMSAQNPWDTSSLTTKFHFVPRQTIFPDSSSRLIGDEELAKLDCPTLWIARNEIFHRHGYCFSTPRGQDYFSNSTCTTPDQDVVKRQATGTPVQNINRIIVEESRRGCRGGKLPVAAGAGPVVPSKLH